MVTIRRRLLRLLKRFGVHVVDVEPGIVLLARKDRADRLPVGPIGRRASQRTDLRDPKKLFGLLAQDHIADLLARYRVNCVLDVGANTGQYAKMLRRAGYQGHIVSFEPVPAAFAKLDAAAAKDPRWTAYPYALGSADGHTDINVVFGTMSSVLPPSGYGSNRYKRFRNIRTHTAVCKRLDSIMDSVVPASDDPRIYLKLDTQGYDVEVFDGLGERAKALVGMQSEVALLQIYDGMPRLPEAVQKFESAGFEIAGMFPVTQESDTLRVLEYDCTMVRADAL